MAELVVVATDFDVLHAHHAVYATARAAAAADFRGKATGGGGDWWYYRPHTDDDGWYSDYQIGRGFLLFDTSPLGVGAVILSAKVSLYHVVGGTEADVGHATLHVVEGVQDIPLELSDYGDHLDKTESGGSVTEAEIAAVENDFVDIELNATGRGWINKTGMTKLCLRVAGDKDNQTPTGINGDNFGSTDGWNGHDPDPNVFPKLTITYSPAVAAPINKAYALSREEL